MNYKEILKLKWPDKNPIQYSNDTYSGIVWNPSDSTPNPTKEELDAAIAAVEAEASYIIGEPIFMGIAAPYSNLSLADTGVTPGTYQKVTVDKKGRVMVGANLTSADIPALDWSKITTGKPTTLAGYGITDAITAGTGKLLSVGYSQIGAMSGTSIIPVDNTVPLITEGTQLASWVVTPGGTDSKIRINGSMSVDANNGRGVSIAIFRNSTCISAQTTYVVGDGKNQSLSFDFVDSPNTVAQVTYTVRIGVSSAATWYVNQKTTGGLFGSASTSSITFMEFVQ